MSQFRAKKIFVSGSSGQLGNEIRKISISSPYEFIFLSRDQLDLSSDDEIEELFQTNDFDYFLNCAAYTKVELAESFPEKAQAINHLAVKKIAEMCKIKNVCLIHISTDYVFDGQLGKPYSEDAECNPINHYGSSKRDGEIAIRNVSPSAFIIRTSWLYSFHGINFINKIIQKSRVSNSIRVVSDQIGSPTFAEDLANVVLEIIDFNESHNKRDGVELFHYSNHGFCSWNDFATEAFRILKVNCKIESITTNQLESKLERPMNSALDTEKISEKLGIVIPSWKVSLESFLLRNYKA